MRPLHDMVTPMLTPVSFLLVFRLGRAAVRWWDARAAAGKIVEACRTLASTAIAGCAGTPALIDGFARWTCVFPLAVKAFLQPPVRRGWQQIELQHKQRFEVGTLLSDAQAETLLVDPTSGFAPIAVLDELRRLAVRAGRPQPPVATEGGGGSDSDSAEMRASVFRRLDAKIDTLTGAFGAMERINATPLPFAYVVHLRTCLIFYLLAWHLDALAAHGWSALLPLTVVTWALIGIEAAAVECERPFMWEANHLALGRMCVVVSLNVGQTLRTLGDGPRRNAAVGGGSGTLRD